MRYYNQQSGPWDAVAQITSAIMQRNQQRAQDKKDLQSTQSLFGLLQPSEVDTGTGMRSQVNFDPALQTVKGAGAPQGGLFDFAKIGQTPPIYSGPQEQQQPSIGLMQPQQITGQKALTMPQQPTPQIQTPTITQRERTIKDVEGDIRKNYVTRMQDAIKSGNINPTMLRQYMPQIQQQMNSEIEQARGDYKKSQGDAALQDVMNAKGSADQKKALIKYAQTTGNVDMATLRGLLSSNTQKYDDGANIHFYRTDSIGNPVDVDQEGKPVPFYSIDKKVSPELLATQKFQAEQNDLNRAVTIRGQDMTAARASSGGGGSNGNGRYVDTPLGRMTPAQVLSAYKQAQGGEVTTDDGFGGVKTRRVPPNPDILAILEPIVKGARQELGLPPIVDRTGNPSIDKKIEDMRAAGAPEQLINDMVWEEQNKAQRPQPQQQPIYTGSEYLGF